MITCVECSGVGQHIDTEIGVISCLFCGGTGEATPLDLPPEQLTMRQLMNWYLRPEIQIYRYSTRIVFNANPKLEFVEFINRAENEWRPTNNEYLFNVASFSEIINLVNRVNPIVLTFPDGTDWNINLALVSCFEPITPSPSDCPGPWHSYLQPNSKGYLALAKIRINYYGVIEYSPTNASSHFVGKLED